MESTSFNLQFAIDSYIEKVNNQGSITSADAMELTAHLYDATADLQQNNLTEEEAFMIACKRLGNEIILTEEYAKVNPSVNTNKIWAYLFIGFNMLYTLPSILLMGVALLYYGIHKYFGDSNIAAIFVTFFHIIFIVLVCYVVKQKNTISQFIEKQVNMNVMKFTLLSFLPFLLLFGLNPIFKNLNITRYLTYPMYILDSDIAELTYLAAGISSIGAGISLVFTIKNRENFTLRNLFEKPSILFLICFGVLIELMAASTRAFNSNTIYTPVVLFGIVYLMATFLISYYNKSGNIKYILCFVVFGFIAETSVGISNDLDRGNFYHTTYFVAALLLGVLAGRLLGLKYGEKMITKPA